MKKTGQKPQKRNSTMLTERRMRTKLMSVSAFKVKRPQTSNVRRTQSTRSSSSDTSLEERTSSGIISSKKVSRTFGNHLLGNLKSEKQEAKQAINGRAKQSLDSDRTTSSGEGPEGGKSPLDNPFGVEPNTTNNRPTMLNKILHKLCCFSGEENRMQGQPIKVKSKEKQNSRKVSEEEEEWTAHHVEASAKINSKDKAKETLTKSKSMEEGAKVKEEIDDDEELLKLREVLSTRWVDLSQLKEVHTIKDLKKIKNINICCKGKTGTLLDFCFALGFVQIGMGVLSVVGKLTSTLTFYAANSNDPGTKLIPTYQHGLEGITYMFFVVFGLCLIIGVNYHQKWVIFAYIVECAVAAVFLAIVLVLVATSDSTAYSKTILGPVWITINVLLLVSDIFFVNFAIMLFLSLDDFLLELNNLNNDDALIHDSLSSMRLRTLRHPNARAEEPEFSRTPSGMILGRVVSSSATSKWVGSGRNLRRRSSLQRLLEKYDLSTFRGQAYQKESTMDLHHA